MNFLILNSALFLKQFIFQNKSKQSYRHDSQPRVRVYLSQRPMSFLFGKRTTVGAFVVVVICLHKVPSQSQSVSDCHVPPPLYPIPACFCMFILTTRQPERGSVCLCTRKSVLSSNTTTHRSNKWQISCVVPSHTLLTKLGQWFWHWKKVRHGPVCRLMNGAFFCCRWCVAQNDAIGTLRWQMVCTCWVR